MNIIGLTGGIASGKSTVSAMIRRMGLPVHDADATVHQLLAPGGAAVAAVAQAFPGTLRPDGGIDRAVLGQRVFGDPEALQRLEAIIHPLTRRAETRFLQRHRRFGTPLVVLDIPLLLETGGQRRCDAVMVVVCPPFLQRQRALRRPGMTVAKLDGILARQATPQQRRKVATWLIPSGLGKIVTFRAVRRIITGLTCHDQGDAVTVGHPTIAKVARSHA